MEKLGIGSGEVGEHGDTPPRTSIARSGGEQMMANVAWAWTPEQRACRA